MGLPQLLTSITRWTKLKVDADVSGKQLLLRTWQLLILGNMLLCLEHIHDTLPAIIESSTASAEYYYGFGVRVCHLCVFIIIGGLSLCFRSPPSFLSLITILIILHDYTRTFPFGANHYHFNSIMMLVCSCAMITIRRGENRDTPNEQLEKVGWDAIYFLRWLVVYLMIWTGLNKLLYGTYFRGEFLAMVVNKEERFRDFYAFFLTKEELQQLTETQFGPFRFQSLLAIVGSNLVYLTEIIAGILLLIPRSRQIGAGMTFLVLIGIEIAAREWVFGSLLIQALLLYFPKFFLKYGVSVSALLYLLVCSYFVLRMTNLIPNLGIT